MFDVGMRIYFCKRIAFRRIAFRGGGDWGGGGGRQREKGNEKDGKTAAQHLNLPPALTLT